MEETGEFNRTRHYALYEIPDEGFKVHERETVREGSMERPHGQPPAELGEVSGRRSVGRAYP